MRILASEVPLYMAAGALDWAVSNSRAGSRDIAAKYLFGRKRDQEEIPGSSAFVQHSRGLLGHDERQHGIA